MPEKITFHIAELIAAITFVLGGGGLSTILAKKKGWVTFGTPTERRSCPTDVKKICGEHNAMILDISNIVADVSKLHEGQELVYELLRQTDRKVERLIGYHQGSNGVDLSGHA